MVLGTPVLATLSTVLPWSAHTLWGTVVVVDGLALLNFVRVGTTVVSCPLLPQVDSPLADGCREERLRRGHGESRDSEGEDGDGSGEPHCDSECASETRRGEVEVDDSRRGKKMGIRWEQKYRGSPVKVRSTMVDTEKRVSQRGKQAD